MLTSLGVHLTLCRVSILIMQLPQRKTTEAWGHLTGPESSPTCVAFCLCKRILTFIDAHAHTPAHAPPLQPVHVVPTTLDLLRLLLHLHHRVAPSKLEALQKALEPTGQVRPHACLRSPDLCARVCPLAGLPVEGVGCADTHTHVPWASPAEWRGREGAVFPAWREARAAGPPEA